MDRERLIDVLEDAGLSPYKADAYVTLLEVGSASATELAEASDVPDARIYDVLRDLDELGYVELYEQDTFRARAVDPETVVEDLTARASEFEAAATEIRERYQQPALDDHAVSIVRRFETVEEAAAGLVAQADTQVHAALTPEQFESLRDELAAAYERGVTVDVSLLLGDDDPDPDPGRFEGVCSAVRTRPRPSPFMVVSDLWGTAFAPNPATVEEYGMVLENRSFTYVFYWYFLSFMWLPWPAVHSEVGERTPVRYADIRQLLLEYGPLLRDGATVSVEVDGRDVATDEEIALSGPLVVGERDGGPSTSLDEDLLELTGTASLAVDAEEGVVTVGGWGTLYEDVEARRVTVTGVEHDGA